MILKVAYYVLCAACILGIAYELIPDHVIKFWRYHYGEKRKRASSPEADRPTA